MKLKEVRNVLLILLGLGLETLFFVGAFALMLLIMFGMMAGCQNLREAYHLFF